MRFRRILPAMVCLIRVFTASAATPDRAISWPELTAALHAFQDAPSAETATAVLSLLPREGPISFDKSSEANLAMHALEDALPGLDLQVQARERESVRLAFHLLAIPGGSVLESVEILLGKLITIDARLFLEELLRWRTQLSPRILGHLVGTFGEEHGEQDRAAVCAEIQRRIEALSAVTEANLLEARDQCVAQLEERRPRCK